MKNDKIPHYLRIRECERLDNLEFVPVTKITLLKGNGTHENPCRHVNQYWDMKGNFLFEIDPCNETELQKSYKKESFHSPLR